MTKWDTIQSDILPVIPRSWDLEEAIELEDEETEFENETIISEDVEIEIESATTNYGLTVRLLQLERQIDKKISQGAAYQITGDSPLQLSQTTRTPSSSS